MLRLLKEYRMFLLLLLFLVLLSSLFVMISPIFINYCIQAEQKITIHLIFIIVGVLLFSHLIQILIIYIREKFAVKFNISKAKELYNKMFRLQYDKMISFEPTYTIERIGIAINSIYAFLAQGITAMVSSFIICLISLCMIFYINPILMIILFAMLPINYFGFKYLNKELQKKAIHMQDQTSTGFKEIVSVCRHSDYIKQLGDTEHVIELLNPSFNRIYKSISDVNIFGQVMSSTLRMLNSLVKNITILTVSIYILNGETQVTNIILISILLPIYFEAINQIINTNIQIRDLKGSNEFIETLDNNEEEDGSLIIDSINEIRFDIEQLKINEKVLSKNIKGTFCKGDIVGITGDSGKGKSTLLKLIPKFRLTDTIYINGYNIRDLNNNCLRNNISFVTQDIPILPLTIKENILFGRNEENVDMEKLQNSTLLKTITKLKSLDEKVHENGTNLSGGEKQKIAILRELLNDTDVILLDEITSNIDKDSAREIYESIQQLSKDKIIFLISHDQDNLKYCNKRIDL